MTTELAEVKRSIEAKMATKEQLAEVERHTGVKIERIESKIDALSEGIGSMRGELLHEIRTRDERQSRRMGDLEDVVRRHSRDITAIHKRLRISR